MSRSRSTAALTAFAVAIGSAALLPVAVAPAAAATAAVNPCKAFTQLAYQRVNPKNGAQLITLNASEAATAGAKYGYTQNLGVAFKASASGKGAVVVHRLTRSKPTDAYWTANPAEIANLKKNGYVDRGGSFLAAAKAGSCVIPVYGVTRKGMHRQTSAAATLTALKRAGWVSTGVSFYAASAKTSAPTPTPPVSTPKPSPSPTTAPKPIATPTAKPSASPTAAPTTPTAAPTTPTAAPTTPTAAPSTPTAAPTTPTAAPTTPTAAPTTPTAAPTTPTAPPTAPIGVPTPPTGVPVADSNLPTGPTDLDASGQTIPDTNYPIPAGATFISPTGNDANPGTLAAPVKTLNRAIDMTPANGTIVFRGGVYRDAYSKSNTTYTIAGKGVTLQAYPHESPWLDGSDVVSADNWTSDGAGHWSAAWSTPQFCGGKYYNAPPTSPQTACTYPDMIHGTALNPVPADPQQVFVDGNRQHETDSLAKVDGSDFYYDWAAQRMYIGVDPNAHTIELTKRPMALVLAGNNRNSILGLGIRRFGSYPYEGVNAAVYVGGFATVKDSVFADNSALGLSFSLHGQPSTVSHTVFADNGFTGLAANGTAEKGNVPDDNFMIKDNVFNHENWEDTGVGCTVSCGQAAVKLAHMRGYTLTGNLVESTGGGAVGLWCDLDCSGGVYTSNVVRDQPKSSGIFVEVSDSTIVANNLVTGNLYGISVASAHTKIFNNTLIDNVQAIRIYDDHRSRGKDWGGKVWNDVGPDTTGIQIGNNLTYSSSYSIIAFPMTAGSVAPNTGAESFFTSIDHNAFFQASSASPTFVKMTMLSGVTNSYKDAASMAAATGFEGGSLWVSGVDPFVNRAAGDYRIKSQYVAQLPTAVVPNDVAAALGATAGAPMAMGAGNLNLN